MVYIGGESAGRLSPLSPARISPGQVGDSCIFRLSPALQVDRHPPAGPSPTPSVDRHPRLSPLDCHLRPSWLSARWWTVTSWGRSHIFSPDSRGIYCPSSLLDSLKGRESSSDVRRKTCPSDWTTSPWGATSTTGTPGPTDRSGPSNRSRSTESPPKASSPP